MGMTSVKLTIKNPQDPKKTWSGDFLVDSRATYTVVPGDYLKMLRIKPEDEETLYLADGTPVKRKVGNALYEYKGVQRAAPVLFGEKKDALLLGTLTLEALGLILDPLQRRLYKAHLMM